ncbi:sensor domain-containing protein [Fodinicola acaciae]|uniref:sensor domain-containing protein n=1 Tax=Fodinicola acaciae TaxID=2681555 RepID=UPI0013D67D5E|nr:sensor domain-containing protein [Fodinicola acaciae]
MTNTASTPVLSGEHRPLLRRTGLDTAYGIGNFPVAVVRFVVLVTLFAVGIGTAVIGIGVPILVFALLVARWFADVERHWTGQVSGRPAPRPAYRSADGRKGLERILFPITEPQSWRDFLYGVFAFVPSIVAFVLTITWWAVGVGGTLYFLWGWSLPAESHGLAYLIGLGSSYGINVMLNTAIGLVFLATAPLVVRALAGANTAMSRVMLTTDWIGSAQK